MDVIYVLSDSDFSPSGGVAHIKVGKNYLKTDCLPVSDSAVALKFPFDYFNPLQSAFLKLKGDSDAILCVAPTSAGKSVLAHFIFSKEKGRKLYLAPTKALIEEKYEEFKLLWGKDKIAVRTGDRFEFFPPKEEIVLATYEACLASARSRSPWFEEAKSVCVDEIHFLFFGDDRGILLEELISYLKYEKKKIIALSATVPDDTAYSLSDWLGSKLIISNWRPVPLQRIFEGNLSDVEMKYFGENLNFSLPEKIVRIAEKLSTTDKIIIFVYKKDLGWSILQSFDRFGFPILNQTCPFEKKTVLKSSPLPLVAFHNADIPVEEKQEIEKEFRYGAVKYLVSTSTMAYGVNLPADEAFLIVRSFKSKVFPDISTIIQMEGRVGRFGLSKKGISHIVVLSGKSIVKEELKNFFAEPDHRTSLQKLVEGDEERRITDEDALSIMLLGMASRYSISEAKNVVKQLKTKMRFDFDNMIHLLEREGCIQNDKVTPLGKALAASLLPPRAFSEFRRRMEIKWDDYTKMWAFRLKPLLFRRHFDIGFVGLLRDDLKESLRTLIQYSGIPEENDRSYDTSVLWVWMSGQLWKYFKSPPAQFHTKPDVLSLARFLSTIKYQGIINTSLDEIHRLLLSLLEGVHPDYSLVCSLDGIGFSRGNAIASVGFNSRKNLNDLFKETKDSTFVNNLENVLKNRFKYLEITLFSEWAQRDKIKRAQHDELIKRIKNEATKIQEILKGKENADDFISTEIVRIFAYVKEGTKVLSWGKDSLIHFLHKDGQYIA